MIFLILAIAYMGAPPVLPSSQLLIHDVHVLNGDEKALVRGDLLISGQRIIALTPVKSTVIPKTDHTIDGHGKILTPGLWAVGSALGLTDIGTEELRSREEAVTTAFAGDAINILSPFVLAARSAGITSSVSTLEGSMLNGSGAWFRLFSDYQAVMPQPVVIAVNMLTTNLVRVAGSQAAGWQRLRTLLGDAKQLQQQGGNCNHTLSLPCAQLQALLPLLRRQVPLLMQVDRAADIVRAVFLSEQLHIKLMIHGGAEAHLVASLLAKKEIPVLITPANGQPSTFDRVHASFATATLLAAAHVPLILTSGRGADEVARLRQQAGMAIAEGLAELAALKAITQTPARWFGHGKTGVLAPGMPADFVLWSGDPFETTTVAERIWIDGKEQDLTTRSDLLARKYLP